MKVKVIAFVIIRV